MKKNLFLFSLLLLPFPGKTQTAPDFTIVTTDSVSRNLYSTLAQGKTVILDFFYPTCQGCWYYSPVIEQAYQSLGAGSGNVELWGINGGIQLVNNAAINAYKTQYGITSPCASGTQGNGAFVDSLYRAVFPTFYAYPMYAVVCPDKHIYININYPPTANGFNTYVFDSCGTTISVAEQTGTTNTFSVSPNPATDFITITLEKETDGTVRVTDLSGKTLLENTMQGYTNRMDIRALPAGYYMVTVSTANKILRKKVAVVRR